MAELSIYQSHRLLNWQFRGQAAPWNDAGIWLALFSTMPQTNGTGGVEASHIVRTRIDPGRTAPTGEVADLWQTDPIGSAGHSAIMGNSSAFATAPATGDEPANIVGAGFYDAATGGNLLALVDAVPAGRVIRPTTGVPVTFAINQVTIGIPVFAASVMSTYLASQILQRWIQQDNTVTFPTAYWIAHLSGDLPNRQGSPLTEATATPRKQLATDDFGDDPAQKQLLNTRPIVHNAQTATEPAALTAAALFDADGSAGSGNFLWLIQYQPDNTTITPQNEQRVQWPASALTLAYA